MKFLCASIVLAVLSSVGYCQDEIPTSSAVDEIPTSSAVDEIPTPSAGKEFYLMFMPNIVELTSLRRSLALIISNPDFYNIASLKIMFTVKRRRQIVSLEVLGMSSLEYQLPGSVLHARGGLGNRTVFVTSNSPITIVGVNRQKYSTDTFLALPVSSLGVGYIGACYTANIRTQIGIVATEDDTLIRITLPQRPLQLPDFAVAVEHNGIYYSNADGAPFQFTIRMNRLDSYLLAAKGDLTATQIRSNKIISVFSGNVRAKVSGTSRDHLIEQLLPVYAWQSVWYTMATPMRVRPDIYRILSNTVGTQVSIQLADGKNVSQLSIASPREFAEIEIAEFQPVRFTCSPGNCLVYQISCSVAKGSAPKKRLGDPSMFIGSNPYAFGAYKYIYKVPESGHGSSFQTNQLALMSREKINLMAYMLYGKSEQLDVTWLNISSWGMYYAFVEARRDETVIIQTDSNVTFIAWLHGTSDRESYSHSLGYRMNSPLCLSSDGGLMTPGDGVDNDCDSLTDEEPGVDGIDNDNDGLIDEDVSVAVSKLSSGREYLLMFMENTVDYPVNVPMEVFLGGLSIDSTQPTNVTVSYPLASGARDTFNIHVYPREVHKIELNYTIMQLGTGLESKSVRITAENDIVVYGINKEQFSADGFIAIPVSSYGKEYFTVSYYPPTSRSEFAVIAPENGTTVRIFFPPVTHDEEKLLVYYAGRSYSNDDRLIVRMNALETLQIQDDTGTGDLSGTRIVADKNIAVFSGNVRTFVTYDGVAKTGSRDHLVQQMPPVTAYGTKFAMMTTPGRTVGDVFKIVTSEDSTRILICVRRVPRTHQECEKVELGRSGSHHTKSLFQSNSYIYMTSDKPILVVQITRSQVNESENADPVMMLIAPIEQYSKDYTFLTPTLSNPDDREDYKFHYLLVIIEESKIDGLMIDNNRSSFDDVVWERIPDGLRREHNLVATSVKLPFALHTLTHTDPSAVCMGLLYGVADRESYGFPIGLKIDTLQFCTAKPGVEGDLLDNDCDGQFDEEICDNELDDDNDGSLDEDCASLPTSYVYLAMFMENNVEYPPANYPLRLYGASYNMQVVRVTTPKYRFEGVSYDRAQLVDSEEILNFGMRPDIRHIGSGVSNRGIMVRSQYPIDLFGSNEEKFSHDCFLVLPSSLLGLEYYTVHSSPSTLQQQFSVMALHNHTTVTVLLASTLVGKVEFSRQEYNAGSEFSFILNIGETAQVQTKDLPAAGLTGTRVTSTLGKPIAVFSGNVRTMISADGLPQKSRDHLVEQLLPYKWWGRRYLAPGSPLRNHTDIYVFVTNIFSALVMETWNGRRFTMALFADQENILKLDSGDEQCYSFTASSPFQVVRLTASQVKGGGYKTDPAMLLLISSDHWKDRYTLAPPVHSGGTSGGNYANVVQLVITLNQTEGIQINGKDMSLRWNRIGKTDYVTANVKLSHVDHLSISHVNNMPFMAYLYGAADRESYAMPCGIKQID